jgi:N-acetylglucosamine kinase-like BadF-type ATPase
MKLIVDSGSTKADWIAIDEHGKIIFTTQTLGLNPEVLNKEEIIERLDDKFDIEHNRKEAKALHFYGAGCGTERMIDFLKTLFKNYFPNATIDVREDTYAAVFATTPKNEKAIVCILGTGSNCSYFDGKILHQKVQSLGYIAMDDCSGNRLGRDLLRGYFFNKIPAEFKAELDSDFDMNVDTVKQNLYKEPNPNAYMAKFAKFVIKNKDHKYFKKVIKKEMKDFIENYIMQYENYQEVPIHFVGSIAFYLKDDLIKMLTRYGITAGNILRRPIDGLITYHTK